MLHYERRSLASRDFFMNLHFIALHIFATPSKQLKIFGIFHLALQNMILKRPFCLQNVSSVKPKRFGSVLMVDVCISLEIWESKLILAPCGGQSLL